MKKINFILLFFSMLSFRVTILKTFSQPIFSGAVVTGVSTAATMFTMLNLDKIRAGNHTQEVSTIGMLSKTFCFGAPVFYWEVFKGCSEDVACSFSKAIWEAKLIDEKYALGNRPTRFRSSLKLGLLGFVGFLGGFCYANFGLYVAKSACNIASRATSHAARTVFSVAGGAKLMKQTSQLAFLFFCR